MILALSFGEAAQGASEQDDQHEDRFQRERPVSQRDVQPADQTDDQQRFLQACQRLPAEDLPLQRAVQTPRASLQQRTDLRLAAHRLERLHDVQHVGELAEDALQQIGLPCPGPAGHAHQAMRASHDRHPERDSGQGCLPRDDRGEPETQHGLDAECDDRDRVQIGSRCPLGFGGERVGKAADRLPHVVFPARGEQRAHQRQAQVGRDVGDGISDLFLRQQDERGFERNAANDDKT